jgi:hypothetical protein
MIESHSETGGFFVLDKFDETVTVYFYLIRKFVISSKNALVETQ